MHTQLCILSRKLRDGEISLREYRSALMRLFKEMPKAELAVMAVHIAAREQTNA